MGNTMGTSYSPPVKSKLLSLKFQYDTCLPVFKAHVAPASCSDIGMLIDGSLTMKANLFSERYHIRRAVAAKHPLSRFQVL